MKMRYVAVWLLFAMVPMAVAADVCPPAVPVSGQFGPFDYNDPDNKGYNLHIVEQYHFSPAVEQLQRGESGSVGGDLDYVLRAFPNHPRALNAMARLALRDKTDKPTGAHFSVKCYFDRAFGFVPSDGIVHMIYGNYLYKLKNNQKAMEQYQQAEKLDPQNPNILYNEGLLYFDMKDYDKAQEYAEKAYSAGFPLPGLRMKLEKIGKWKSG